MVFDVSQVVYLQAVTQGGGSVFVLSLTSELCEEQRPFVLSCFRVVPSQLIGRSHESCFQAFFDRFHFSSLLYLLEAGIS